MSSTILTGEHSASADDSARFDFGSRIGAALFFAGLIIAIFTPGPRN